MSCVRATVIVVILGIVQFVTLSSSKLLEDPFFSQEIENVTIPVGKVATLACVVEGLVTYKVAWLRVDTQTILTIHTHIITKNPRIGITHSELRTWYLHIKDVKESDRGWYMCQINTDPMKSQVGYLNVVVPPDILDYQSSGDMVVDEGSNVSLRCMARGSPEPSITWKRENGQPIYLDNGENVSHANGQVLNLTAVKREQMGAYLCIASNRIPPSMSKRIMLVVQFPPKIWIQYQLVGAYDDQEITLQCRSEAYPTSINYWTRSNGQIIAQSANHHPEVIENGYEIHMKLTLLRVRPEDYGLYKCISKNSIGETEGTINVYRLPSPSANKKFYSRNNNLQKDQMLQSTYQTDLSLTGQASSPFLEDILLSSARRNAVAVPVLGAAITYCYSYLLVA